MKKMLVCALAVAMIAMCGSAFAQGKVWDDLSWWGQSGATPAPVKDCCRSGYWWWPKEPKSNANDTELWGNRGVVYSQLIEKAKPAPPAPPPANPPTPKRTVILNHVLFDFDKAVLKPEGKAVCDEAVKNLKDHGKDTIVIEGHTCDVGEEAYNMGLGQRRADAVKKYLVEQGVAESRLTTKSLGETKPAVPNDGPANRKLNRRVVFDYAIVN